MRVHNILFILAQLSVGSSHFGFDDAISNEKENVPLDSEKNDALFYSNRFAVPHGGENFEDIDSTKDVENKNIEQPLPHDELSRSIKLNKDNTDAANNEIVTKDIDTDNFSNISTKYYGMVRHLLKYGGIRIFDNNNEDTILDLKLVDTNLNMTKSLKNGTKLISEMKNVDKNNIVIIINNILTSENVNKDDNIYSTYDDLNMSSTLKIIDNENKDMASSKVHTNEDVKKLKDHNKTMTLGGQHFGSEDKFSTRPDAELDPSKVMGSGRRMDYDMDYTDRPPVMDIDAIIEATGNPHEFKLKPPRGPIESFIPGNEGLPAGPGLGGRKAANQVKGQLGQPTNFGKSTATPDGEMDRFGAGDLGDYGMIMNDEVEPSGGTTVSYEPFDDATINLATMRPEDMYDYAQMAAEDHSRTSTIAIKEDAARAPTPGTTVRETEHVSQDHTDKNLGMDDYERKMTQPNNLISQIRMQYPFLDKASGVEYSPEPDSLQNNMRMEIENKMYGIKPINPPPDFLGLLNSDSKPPQHKQPYQPNNKLQTPAPIYPVNNQNAMSNLPGITSNFPSAIPNYQNDMSYFPSGMPNFQSSMPNFPGVMPNFPSAMTKYPNALPNFSGYMSYFPSSGPNFPGVTPNFPNAMTNFPTSLPYFPDTVSNTPITQHAVVRRTNDLGSYLYSEYDLTLTPLIDAITSATSDNTSTASKMEQSISPKTDKLKYVADTVSPVTNDVTIGLSSIPMAVVSSSQSEISFQSPVIVQNFAPPMPFRSDNVYVHAPTMVNETVRRLVTDFNTSPSEATTAVTVTSTPDQQVAVNTSALTFTTKEYHWYDNESFRRNTAIPVTSTKEEVTINSSTTRKDIVDIRVRGVVEETQYKTPLTTSPTAVVQIRNVVTESEPEISTLSDLINNFVSKMMKLDSGYLTTFASLSAEYLAMKNFTVLQELSNAFVKEWDKMTKSHKTATFKFGKRWLMEIIHLKRTLLAADVFKLMEYVLNVHLALNNRNVSLSTDLNMLLSFIDTLFTPSEGEKMARVAEHIRQYPNKVAEGHTASYIMKDMLYEVVLYPFIRLDTSLNKKLLIDGITVYLNKYRGDGSFNKSQMETKSRRADSPQNFIDLEKNEATATDDAEEDPTRTGESGQRYQHRLARDRYRIPVKTSLATFGTDLMHGQRQSFTLANGKNKSKPVKVKHNCKHNCKQNCRMAATRGETSTTQQSTDQKHTSTNNDSKQNLPKGYQLHMRRPTPYTRYDRSKIFKYDTMINDYLKKRKVDGESSFGTPFSSFKRHSKERSHNREAENHGNNGVIEIKRPNNARETENHVNNGVIEIKRPDNANETEVTIHDDSYSMSAEREPEAVDFLPEEDKRKKEHKRQYLKHKSVKGDENFIVNHVNDNHKLNFTVQGFYTERSPTRRNKRGRRYYDNIYDNPTNNNEFSTLYNGGNYNKNNNFKYNNIDDIRESHNGYKEIKNMKPLTISNSLLDKKKKYTDKSLHYIEHEFINKIKQKFHSLRHRKEDSHSVMSNLRSAKTNGISPNDNLFENTKYIQTSSSVTQFFNPRNKFHNNGVTKIVGITRKPMQEIKNINQDEIAYYPYKRALRHPKIIYPTIHEPTHQSHYLQTKKLHIQMAYVPHKSKGNTHYIKPQHRVNSSHRFVRRKKIKPEFDIPDENGRRMDVSAEVIDDIDHVGELINKQNILHSESDDKILWDKIDEIETRLNKHMPSRRKYVPREPRQREPQAAVHYPIPFRSDLTASTFQHKAIEFNSKVNLLSQQQKEEPDKRAIVIM